MTVPWHHLASHPWDVATGPEKTVLSRDGEVRFEADAGVVVREYQVESSSLSFKLKSEKPVHIAMREFESGTFRINMDGKSAGRMEVRQGVGKMNLPAGEHTVELSQ